VVLTGVAASFDSTLTLGVDKTYHTLRRVEERGTANSPFSC
jgi:hypothetical protein